MSRRISLLFVTIVLLSLVLAACGGGQATQAPAQTAPTQAPAEPTKAPEPTTAPEATKAPEPTQAPEATKAPEATTAPAAGDAKTITVWHQWDGKYLDAITAVFKDYEAAHPGVKIDLSKPDDVANALQVAIPAGQGPDIIGWANDKIGTLALNGNIVGTRHARRGQGIPRQHLRAGRGPGRRVAGQDLGPAREPGRHRAGLQQGPGD